ncbi:MAG: SET domain-containing protein-lysine N-methyltransferase [Pirellulales bacterium]|nr:SET domain-containing protein-lysine N-methyltransferase [Pirellulales bacterium]
MDDFDPAPPSAAKSARSRARAAVEASLSPDAAAAPRRIVRRKTRVRIGNTRVGKGVFAQKWYRAHDIVGEIKGAVVTDEDYSSEYCMDLEDGSCLEPDAPFRYLNHSCEPNCRFTWHDLREQSGADVRRRIFLYALRAIRPEEELTIDYGWPASYAIPCRCGAASCRGWIVAEDELSAVADRKA